MTRLVFDGTGEKEYEAGVSQGVLFPGAPSSTVQGVVWNGLTNFTKSPEGGEANDQWADDIKYASIRGAENIKGTIEAFMFPKEFHESMGEKELVANSGVYVAQQTKKPFSFACLTKIGNDTEGLDFGSKIHIVYNATVNPTEMAYETMNNSPEAITMSWEFDTVPVAVTSVTGIKPTAYLCIEKREETAEVFQAVYNKIYGTDEPDGNSSLPMPDDVYQLIQTAQASALSKAKVVEGASK